MQYRCIKDVKMIKKGHFSAEVFFNGIAESQIGLLMLKKLGEKGNNSRFIWNLQRMFVSLQRERRNRVEPRCAERWHLCDDEQFDLAAWFPSLKHSWSHVASFFIS